MVGPLKMRSLQEKAHFQRGAHVGPSASGPVVRSLKKVKNK
jgi:hypothetical protein